MFMLFIFLICLLHFEATHLWIVMQTWTLHHMALSTAVNKYYYFDNENHYH